MRHRGDGVIDLAAFGYKSHIWIDRRYRFIREMAVTSASVADGCFLRHVVSTDNTGSDVWAEPKASATTATIAQCGTISGCLSGCSPRESTGASPCRSVRMVSRSWALSAASTMLIPQPSVLSEYKLELAQPPRLIMRTGSKPGYAELQGDTLCPHDRLPDTDLI